MKTKTFFMQNLEKKIPQLSRFFLGLSIALASVLVAFEWKTSFEMEPPLPGNSGEEVVFFEEPPVYIIKTSREKVEKPVRKVSQARITVTNILEITDNNTNTSKSPEIPENIEFKPVTFTEEPLPDERDIFSPVEQMPLFPGGDTELMKFLKNNLNYPKRPKELGITGTVYVEFVVEKDGTLSNIKIAKGVSSDLDKEAIRIVQMMPTWIPGSQRNNPVPVGMRLPIRFVLI